MSPSSPVVFPDSMLSESVDLEVDCSFHYNTLRYASYLFDNPSVASGSYTDFSSDPPWAKVLALPCPKKAVVLMASRKILLNRMSSRQYNEPKNLKENSSYRYQNRHWVDVLKRVDLDEFYLSWCSELEKNGIPYMLINSSNELYSIIQPGQITGLRFNA